MQNIMQQSDAKIRIATFSDSWNVNEIKETVKQRIEQLDPVSLPLQRGLTHGSHVTGDPIKAIIIDCSVEQYLVRIKAGIFFSSIIAGCNCADDPTPVDTLQEYCVLEFRINKENGEAEIRLLPES